jgi:hypothetical protein
MSVSSSHGNPAAWDGTDDILSALHDTRWDCVRFCRLEWLRKRKETMGCKPIRALSLQLPGAVLWIPGSQDPGPYEISLLANVHWAGFLHGGKGVCMKIRFDKPDLSQGNRTKKEKKRRRVPLVLCASYHPHKTPSPSCQCFLLYTL